MTILPALRMELKVILLVSFSCICIFKCRADSLDRCPSKLPRNDARKYLAVHGDKCYMFVRDEVHWNEANQRCRQSDGTMITITRSDIQRFVEHTLSRIWQKNGMWIGAHDRDREMYWVWVTGERATGGYTYENWDSGQPSCFLPKFFCHEDCACLRVDEGYKWHDYGCSTPNLEYGYACQYDLLPPPPTRKAPSTTTTTTTSTKKPTTLPQTTTPKPVPTWNSTKATTQQKVPAENTTLVFPSSTLNESIGGVPDNYVHVDSQRYSSNQDENSNTATVAGVVTTVCLLGSVLIIAVFLFRRRRHKKYNETFTIGFNNVLYAAAPTLRDNSVTYVKNNNLHTANVYSDIPEDSVVENRYVDIDDIAGGGAKFVDMPPTKHEVEPVYDTCCTDPVYDAVEPSEMPGKVGHGACASEDELSDAADGQTAPGAGLDPTAFAPDFLKKDTNVSQAYSNNLYGVNIK